MDVAQLEECLSLKTHTQKPWVCSPALYEPNMVVYAYNPSTWDVEAGKSEIQGHPGLWVQSQHGTHETPEKEKEEKDKKIKKTAKTVMYQLTLASPSPSTATRAFPCTPSMPCRHWILPALLSGNLCPLELGEGYGISPGGAIENVPSRGISGIQCIINSLLQMFKWFCGVFNILGTWPLGPSCVFPFFKSPSYFQISNSGQIWAEKQ